MLAPALRRAVMPFPASRVTFVVLGPPRPKQRARRGAGGRWYTPTATLRYERDVRTAFWAAAAQAGVWATWQRAGHFRVELRLHFGDLRRRDADNVAKSVLDGLNGVAWGDDAQVRDLRVHVDVDRARPRLEAMIERICS